MIDQDLSLQKRLESLILRLEAEKIKNGTLRLENKALQKSLRAGNDGAYIAYLQQSLKKMEELHIIQQNTIDEYLHHFNKFRTVYTIKQRETQDETMV